MEHSLTCSRIKRRSRVFKTGSVTMDHQLAVGAPCEITQPIFFPPIAQYPLAVQGEA